MKDFSDYGIKVTSRSSGKAEATCPECSPKRKKKSAKCLTVDFDKAYWVCHHCGWWGYLATGPEGKSRPNWEWKAPEYIRPVLKTRSQLLEEKMVGWFKGRGISKETIDAFGISWDERVWFPQTEDFAKAICFPFFRNGELINIKYRGPQKMFRLAKDAERIFFGLDTLRGKDEGGRMKDEVAKEAIITEGEMDALAIYEAGFHHVMSVPNGAPSIKSKDFDKQFEFIENSRYKLPGYERDILDEIGIFYIAVDQDEPGLRLQEQLIRMLGPERCMRVKWPEGYKDANEVLIGVPAKNLPPLGAKGIEDAIHTAKYAPISGIYQAHDLLPEMLDYYDRGMPPGISLVQAPIGDWDWLGMQTNQGEELYTVEPGMVTGIGGIPGMGKSKLLENILVRLALQEGWSFAYFNNETPPKKLIANLAQLYLGKPFRDGFHERMTKDEFRHASEWIDEHFHFMLPSDGIFTLDDILDKVKLLISRYGVRGVVIDAWNNLEHTRPKNLMRDEYLGQSLAKIEIFKRVYQVKIWLVVHPKNLIKDKNGKYPVPTPYDWNGGSMWFNKMDMIVTGDRDKFDETALFNIHVQKMKFDHLGSLGIGRLAYDAPTGRLYTERSTYGDITYAEGVVRNQRQKTFKQPKETGQLDWNNRD